MAGPAVGVTRPVNLAARLSALPSLFTAMPADACTLCHSRVAAAVRAAVLGADLLANCVAVAAPVPALVLAAFAARRYLL